MTPSRSFHRQNALVVLILLGMNPLTWGKISGMPLYQGTSADVVRNLKSGDTYDEIYLQYHRCVWSEFGNSAADFDNGCEGDGNENSWYMGRTPCYRANVAYSLYGIPTGENVTGSPCSKGTYINSFFSTYGVETFAGSLGFDAGDATDDCEIYSQGNDDAANNGDLSSQNNVMLYAGSTSSTTACAADGSFVQGLFKGAYCSSRDHTSDLGTLSELNSAVEGMECYRIYSADDGIDLASNLLLYSETCSKLEYPMTCPDPFHVKTSKEYLPKSQRALWSQITWMDRLAFVFLGLAVLFFIIPCCNKQDEDELGKTKKRRFCLRRREPSDNASKGGFRQWFRSKVMRRGDQHATSTDQTGR